MRHFRILLLSIVSSCGAIAADITITPGSLENILAAESLKNETSLKLSGAIDARDLAALEKIPPSVVTLDLANVRIEGHVANSRKYFGRTLFAKNEIPAYTFFKLPIKELTLPMGVTKIGEGSFAGSKITSLTIPEGVTAITDYAFYGCTELKTVSLPSSLTTIGTGAFGNCTALESIDLSQTDVTEIPDKAFSGATSLEEIALPISLTTLGSEAFYGTKLSTLDLSRIEEFKAYALSGMPFLKSLTLNPHALIGEGLLMDDISLHSITGVPELVSDYFAANCNQLPTELGIRASRLGAYSYARTLAPEELILPTSITAINRGALYGLSNIKKINVADLEGNIPSVEELTFEGLSQPDIVLSVYLPYADDWRAHPIWGRFKIETTEETGVDKVENLTDGLLNIRCSGDFVTIESADAITDVKIWTPDGHLVFMSSPGERRVDVNISSLPTGIIIVVAADERGRSQTSSILLK